MVFSSLSVERFCEVEIVKVADSFWLLALSFSLSTLGSCEALSLARQVSGREFTRAIFAIKSHWALAPDHRKGLTANNQG
jgi:hypothetical protein